MKQHGTRPSGLSHVTWENAKNYKNGRFLSVNLQNITNATFPVIFYNE